MIGDAAHKMPPYEGGGVNMVMQDAFELTGDAPDLQTAFLILKIKCKNALLL